MYTIYMIFGEKTRLEEYVIEILDSGSKSGISILNEIQGNYSLSVTKQAIYKSLRKLKKEEVIAKSGNHYSLNRVWLQKLNDFTSRHIKEVNRNNYVNILDFEDGDSVTYRFKNPFTLDITWGHLYNILFENNNIHHVMLNHHPHEWLMISRTETEKFWLEQINKRKKIMLFTLSGKTPLDKKFQKDWASEYIKINVGESYGLKPNQYLSVIGDYIFEITTDPEFEKRVDKFFNENDYIDDMVQKQINAISKKNIDQN